MGSRIFAGARFCYSPLQSCYQAPTDVESSLV